MSDSKESLPMHTSQEKSAQLHVDKLLTELETVKETNKDLVEKLQVTSHFIITQLRLTRLPNHSHKNTHKLKIKPPNQK